MLHDRVYFEHENQNVYIDTYVADKVGKYTKSAILVIPGGGYSCICSEREGEPIALAFMPYGYNAFVLHYSVNREKKYPAQLIQVSKAIKHIKNMVNLRFLNLTDFNTISSPPYICNIFHFIIVYSKFLF